MPARPEAGDEEMEGILYLLQEFKGKVVLFGISDVVDIAIMAFLIYKVIMLMRRTNSGAVAKGVLLLLFALGVSTFFHLNTVSYLLQQLMVWGVVALVVIFQPEIRRFLEQMGRTSLGKVFTPEEARNELDSAITQTVDAYTSLSKSKTGALMVLGLAGKGADEATALMRRFREKNQVLDCANLLRLAKERGEERKCHCDRMVYEAVELLEDLLK